MSERKKESRKKINLGGIDPSGTPEFKGGKKKGEELQIRINEKLAALQDLLYAGHKQKVLVILQGMDTSGKDGAIRKVFSHVDPLGIRVATFKAPTAEELDHDFLWRIHRQVPGKGELVIFNRSHYEDVLIVRVRELVPAAVWRSRYAQINEFERMLSESGTTILKFFLHISKDEQKERLQARLDDPTKRWKFNIGDLGERKLWKDYMKAYEEAIQQTSTSYAPWHIVPADAKWYRNLVISNAIVEALSALKMEYPKPDPELEGIVVD